MKTPTGQENASLCCWSCLSHSLRTNTNNGEKWFRLAPGALVRLKSAYIIQCNDFKKDETGKVIEIHCTYLPESKSGNDTSGIRAKGTIHWVSVPHAAKAEVRLYDRLFTIENPGDEEDFTRFINPDSLQIIQEAYIETALTTAKAGDKFQFIRKGYFAVDKDSTADHLIFNRTATLRDTWEKESRK